MMLTREFRPGDLVWFDPGVGYVLPGEVVEFHRAAQVSKDLNDSVFYFVSTKIMLVCMKQENDQKSIVIKHVIIFR